MPIDAAALAHLREEGHARLSPVDAAILEKLIDTLLLLTRELQDERTTLARMRRLFGLRKSEKSSEVLGPKPTEEGGSSGAEGTATATPVEPTTPPSLPEVAPPKPKPKLKGHGRVPNSAYADATITAVACDQMKAGSRCPECDHGTLYALDPMVVLRIVGQAPLAARSWHCERLRCSGCQAVHTAKAPPAAQGEKFDESAASTMAVLRYGAGLPLNRLETLQGHLRTPLPASTQWEVVKSRVDVFLPVYEELLNVAAQVTLLHSDDTNMPVLEWMGTRRSKALAAGNLDQPERTGLFTTGVVAIGDNGLRIALFFTGRQHAGENLAALLARRSAERPAALSMSDALNRNAPKGCVVVDANCLTHARRNFVEQVNNFPAECRFVLEKLGELYGVDALCREHRLTQEQRLEVHARQSAPILAEMKTWMESELEAPRVEANSSLGAAFNYMLKRWDTFTVFTRVAGAPLDNTICERALKKAILHRKGSLFYRSANGAAVGDLYMALIHTAELHGKNPIAYLTALQLHAAECRASPGDWLPWNYERTLAAATAKSAA